MEKPITSPALSLLKNQAILTDHKSEIEDLIQAVGRTGDLYPFQWIQLISFIYEFRPDFILELGRGYGNSTCAFNEICQLMKPNRCSIVSLCLSNDWDKHTAPNLRKVVPTDWFGPLTTLNENIITFDFEKVLKGKERVVIFWDAHGFDLAEIILGKILPIIQDRANLVIMHDLSDARYIGDAARFYGENGIWKGKNDWSGPRLQLGHISSCVEQSIAAIDFCSRNKLPLHSADESYHTEINDLQMECLINTLGSDWVSKNGHWFWFSLTEATVELTFPKVKVKPDAATGTRSILKNLLSFPNNRPAPGQKTDSLDIQQLLNKFQFQSIFDKAGDNLITSLETNFYDETKKKAISKSQNGIYIYPTSPRDHLATPFLPIKRSVGEKEKYVKITLGFDSLSTPEIHCKIFLQDTNFDLVSKNLLSDELLTILKNDCIISIVPLSETISKIRLIINFIENTPTGLPCLIKIEQTMIDQLFLNLLSPLFIIP
jgi:hypothetical protein